MNAAAKTLSHGNIFRGDFSFLSSISTHIFVMLLWTFVITSALSVVYVKNLERQYIHETDKISKSNNHFEMERTQLLLEKSMWSAPGRIGRLASSHLNMVQAKPKAVIILNQ